MTASFHILVAACSIGAGVTVGGLVAGTVDAPDQSPDQTAVMILALQDRVRYLEGEVAGLKKPVTNEPTVSGTDVFRTDVFGTNYDFWKDAWKIDKTVRLWDTPSGRQCAVTDPAPGFYCDPRTGTVKPVGGNPSVFSLVD